MPAELCHATLQDAMALLGLSRPLYLELTVGHTQPPSRVPPPDAAIYMLRAVPGLVLRAPPPPEPSPLRLEGPTAPAVAAATAAQVRIE